MNFLKELKNKPEIQRQAFFVRANQVVKNIKKRLPDEDWERIERDKEYPVEITQRTEPKQEQEREQNAKCK